MAAAVRVATLATEAGRGRAARRRRCETFRFAQLVAAPFVMLPKFSLTLLDRFVENTAQCSELVVDDRLPGGVGLQRPRSYFGRGAHGRGRSADYTRQLA